MDDATTARKPTIDIGDFVSFNSEGAHGDHGLVVHDDETPEGKLAVLRVGRAVAHAIPGDLTVVDRGSLFRGQMVLLVSDPGGQAGVVTSVDTALDLAELHGGAAVIATGVPAAELRRVTSLVHGDYVVSGPWLGRVVQMVVNVDVLFDDGAACRVGDLAIELLEVVDEDLNIMRPDMTSFFYPGQRVRAAAGKESVFQDAQWLSGCWQSAHVEGTVAKVEIEAVFVSWVASAHLGTDQGLVRASAPPSMISKGNSPDGLTFFDSGHGCYWAVTDRCFFRRRRDQEHAEAEFERPMSVVGTRTTADVLWQDGTRRRGVPSASLAPFDTHANEFVPGQRVVSLAAAAAPSATEKDGTADVADAGDAATGTPVARSGVVKSVNIRDQTVRVSWFKAAAPGEVECNETVSAYDLDKDYDHGIFYGDIVIRLRQPPESGSHGGGGSGGCTEAAALPVEGNKEVAGAVVVADDLCWVGRVVDICDDAYVQVKWGDGNTSKGNEGNGRGEGDDQEDNNDNSALTSCGQEGADHDVDCAEREKTAGGVANGDETIYVRTFEDRMDLLRAAMVGAAGTPYQDGLFFFDIQLPPSYPAVPPQVCYRSFGFRVNPNLDNSGTVCLSLLDTFDSEDNERWSPANSTVLQVLVSIQGLVLTAQPYYNEFGYEELIGTPSGARNALPYAENAYVLNLRTMLHLLRRPPAGFEELVRGHFRRRGRFVLRACDAYLKGCPVGLLDADACATAESGQRACSAGLRLALTGIVPRLVEAFTEIDADGCDGLRDSLRSAGGLVPPPACSRATSHPIAITSFN
ncbi:unnamed protein product [Urochloa decumbens]|uniref:UBC core domain-containing protein n=1 Tax=Urochloa decumbens TaxID=240449 RepID=A0ABC8W505_9POAL